MTIEVGDAIKLTYTPDMSFEGEVFIAYGKVISVMGDQITYQDKDTNNCHPEFLNDDQVKIEKCTGCECGNPFALCHPDA